LKMDIFKNVQNEKVRNKYFREKVKNRFVTKMQ